MQRISFFLFLLIFSSCIQQHSSPDFDLQGHRGARGLLPENTIPGFLKAVELNVTTIELDLVVTADRQLLVSHEPWFNHLISTKPDGTPVTEEEAESLNIFEMSYHETQQYDVGLRGNPNFPTQQPVEAAKPLLRDAIAAVESHVEELGLPPVQYNIETKSRPEWYGEFVPEPSEFASLLADELEALNILGRTIVQSFDPQTLIEFRQHYPHVKQALLVSNENSMDENLNHLGYTPEIYSPYYQLVDEDLIRQASQHDMQVIPWTINTVAEMQEMLDLGVNGIITDYPDSARVLW